MIRTIYGNGKPMIIYHSDSDRLRIMYRYASKFNYLIVVT